MTAFYFLPEWAAAFHLEAIPSIKISGSGGLNSPYYVSELAAESMAFAGSMLASYACVPQSAYPVIVDKRLASFWFDMTIRPQGWQMPAVWDEFAGDYQTREGWIRLHTNAPAHRRVALQVLGHPKNCTEMTQAVAQCEAELLEKQIVEQGGCAAVMYTASEWARHPQGKAVSREPLVHWHSRQAMGSAVKPRKLPNPQRPLQGIRILDLTRILAGPTASRFLAAFGAEVLRIDPPGWHEAALEMEVTLGKRCARLDLRSEQGLSTLKELFRACDVIIHAYRPDALEQLGFGAEVRYTLNPQAIDIALNAYGWAGPWRKRRGFDSLVQMSSGIAAHGMQHFSGNQPHPLPVQALDYASGHLLAAMTLYALQQRRDHGCVLQGRTSLARMAECLKASGFDNKPGSLAAETEEDYGKTTERTAWGDAKRVSFPLQVHGIPAVWDYPASPLGSAQPLWL